MASLGNQRGRMGWFHRRNKRLEVGRLEVLLLRWHGLSKFREKTRQPFWALRWLIILGTSQMMFLLPTAVLPGRYNYHHTTNVETADTSPTPRVTVLDALGHWLRWTHLHTGLLLEMPPWGDTANRVRQRGSWAEKQILQQLLLILWGLWSWEDCFWIKARGWALSSELTSHWTQPVPERRV